MEVERPPLTRWTAELCDRAQERRFRRYNLLQQRRAALAALAVILLANLAAFGFSALYRHEPTWWSRAAIQGGIVVAGALIVGALLRVRRPRRLFGVIILAAIFLIVAIAGLIASGPGMGFRGSILVLGGVVVTYLSMPLRLTVVCALAVLYSAITIPTWLLATDALASVDVGYVLVATAVAHLLSLIEARRARQERRVLFAQREALRELSSADPLTGLVNRRAFDSLLEQAWQAWRDGSEPLALVMADIDEFKLLNDSLGHVAGDRALQQIAAAIRGSLPSIRCHAARFGGEEFACLLPGVDPVGARAAAEEIVRAVRAARIPMPGGGAAGVLTVSVGVAAASPAMSAAADLVDAADRQLYRAKRAGRDRVQSDQPADASRRTPGANLAEGPRGGRPATHPVA